MLIPMYSKNLEAQLITNELLDYGLVVINTSRTNAKRVAADVKSALGIDENAENAPLLIHLSTEVDDHGWFDYLIYSDVFDYKPRKTLEIVRIVVRDWASKGSPDIFYARVRFYPYGAAQ